MYGKVAMIKHVGFVTFIQVSVLIHVNGDIKDQPKGKWKTLNFKVNALKSSQRCILYTISASEFAHLKVQKHILV